MNKFKFILFFSLTFLLVLLNACSGEEASKGNSNSGAEDVNANNDEITTIKFMRLGAADRLNPIFDPLIEEFMVENPDIKVISENLGWDDAATKVPFMASSNTLPDVIWSNMANGFDLAENGKLKPL